MGLKPSLIRDNGSRAMKLLLVPVRTPYFVPLPYFVRTSDKAPNYRTPCCRFFIYFWPCPRRPGSRTGSHRAEPQRLSVRGFYSYLTLLEADDERARARAAVRHRRFRLKLLHQANPNLTPNAILFASECDAKQGGKVCSNTLPTHGKEMGSELV